VTKGTRLEIHLPHLRHNLMQIRSRLQPDTKVLAVVKSFAYGADAVAISKCLVNEGIDYLGVAYVPEGVALREAGIEIPILVLHPQTHELSRLVAHQLEPSVYGWHVFNALQKVLEKEGVDTYPIHLKFNTGLNRLGFSTDQAQAVWEQIESYNVKVQGVLSHLAATEDPDEKNFTQHQLQEFEALLPIFGPDPIYHVLNTSGIFNYPNAQYDMVRSGIGLYGYGNEAEVSAQLKPVVVLKTNISQIHQVLPGNSVGYNRGYVASQTTHSATLPLGHADGIGRQYGKRKGAVWIHGRKAPILGNVCMDMIMVDVTGIDCAEGDEVVVFGHPNQSAETFAEKAGTISYEVLTAISQRVKRVVIDD